MCWHYVTAYFYEWSAAAIESNINMHAVRTKHTALSWFCTPLKIKDIFNSTENHVSIRFFKVFQIEAKCTKNSIYAKDPVTGRLIGGASSMSSHYSST